MTGLPLLDYAHNCQRKAARAQWLYTMVRIAVRRSKRPVGSERSRKGWVTRRLAKRGAIEFVGYRVSHNASQHCKPVKVWRSATR